MFFTGTTHPTIDAKQRLAIPAKFRQRLDRDPAGSIWCCAPWITSLDGPSLRLYPESVFETLASTMDDSLLQSQRASNIETTFFSQVEQIEMDTAGRLRIPQPLLDLTGLSQAVTLVGVRNRLELYAREAWENRAATRLQEMQKLVEEAATTPRDGSTTA